MASITFQSNQTVTGTSNADFINGIQTTGNNNDLVYALQDDDIIGSTVSLDNSTLYGGQGDDAVHANNHNVVYGQAGDDFLGIYGDPFYGIYGNNNTLYGGQGNDTIEIDSFGNRGIGNVAYGGVGNSFIYAYGQIGDTLVGGTGNDTTSVFYGTALLLYGNDPGSSIYGDDSIHASHMTASTAYGGQGGDGIFSQFGAGNTFYGGGGRDGLSIDDSSADILYGNQGNDIIFPFGVSGETAYGGQENDFVDQTDAAHDVVYGNKGNDVLLDFRGAGFENGAVFYGGAEGNSVLYGGQGDDTLAAEGAGGDTMYGSGGRNLFAANDFFGAPGGLPPDLLLTVNDLVTVEDFVSGNDSLAMSAVTLGNDTLPGTRVKEQDTSADNASDALSFANTYYSNNPELGYLFVYGGSGAGYLFYNGTDGLNSANSATDGMILIGDNAESSLSFNDIVISGFA